MKVDQLALKVSLPLLNVDQHLMTGIWKAVKEGLPPLKVGHLLLNVSLPLLNPGQHLVKLYRKQ